MQGVPITYRSAAVTGTDDYGNEIITYTDQEMTALAFVPGATTEATEGTTQVTLDAEVYLTAGSVTSPGPLDQVCYAGVTYRVNGAPSSWASPFTGTSGPVMLKLRRVTGATAHEASVAEGT